MNEWKGDTERTKKTQAMYKNEKCAICCVCCLDECDIATEILEMHIFITHSEQEIESASASTLSV